MNHGERFNSITHAVGTAWVLVVLVMVGAGCASSGPAFIVDVSLAPPYDRAEAVSAKALMPMPQRSGVVTVRDRDGQTLEVVDRTEVTGPGRWRASVAGFWTVDLVRETSGAVSIVREDELADNRRVVYDPPLPMLPAVLEMDHPVEHVSAVKLYDLNSGVLQTTGQCTATYRLLGTRRIRLGRSADSQSAGDLAGDPENDPGDNPGAGGEAMTVYVVQTDRRFDLPLVKVQMRLLAGYAPGLGPVVQEMRRDIWLLGLIPIKVEHRVVRVR